MNVNNSNFVQRFFKETIPNVAHTAKARIKTALHAIQNPKEYIASRKIHATKAPIILTPIQTEMYQALTNGESLDKLVAWAQNPKTYADLEKASRMVVNFNRNNLLILRDLNHVFSNHRRDPQMLFKIISFTDFIKSYGTKSISEVGGVLEGLVDYADVYLIPLNAKLLTSIDLRLCSTALEKWSSRDSWSIEEYSTYSNALNNLFKWCDLAKNTEFPKELTDLYPKVLEVQKALPKFSAILNQAENQMRFLPKVTGIDPKGSFQDISNKITALNKGSKKEEDKLTLHEFYFLRNFAYIDRCPLFISEETFGLWKNFATQYLLLPQHSAVSVHFQNATTVKEFQKNAKNLPQRVQATALLAIGKKAGFHVNISTKTASGLTAHGVGPNIYHKELKGFVNPKLQAYDLNLDLLAANLPIAKREEFKRIFPEILDKVARKTDPNLHYPDKKNLTARAASFFMIQRKIDASTSGFTDQKNSFCSEFVMRSIMEATAQTYIVLSEAPPETATFFGLNERQNLQTLSPRKLQEALVQKGLLSPLNNIQQIIRS
ncbi:MAG: hypothetical protein LLF94_03040 [Chlamydiales bacterium]|nr:hypothetical protein [Chlamydiales bacterium]